MTSRGEAPARAVDGVEAREDGRLEFVLGGLAAMVGELCLQGGENHLSHLVVERVVKHRR